jgi:SAM-dependent methyltransferase
MATDWNDMRTTHIIDGIIQNPLSIFRPQLQSMFQNSIGSFKNKRVLVPASGDNRAVFAFHLMGARVTSSDLSQKQLEYSAHIAQKHHWDIEFIQDDVVHLSHIPPAAYDFVYISNGVLIWVDDLPTMYQNIHRVLKPGGHYMMYDAHPFMFPFDVDNTDTLSLKKDYTATGPFGTLEIFNWRLQDILNAMASAGLSLTHMEEMNAEYGTFWVDWHKAGDFPKETLDKFYNSKTNPLYALPQAVALCAKKNGEPT